MKSNPLLSIITVSAFDTSRLEETLESLASLPASIEHVIVIPKGDMASERVCQQNIPSGANFRVLARDLNNGVYAAMNTGAMAANGKYICFWNAGDKLNSIGDLLKLVEVLEQVLPIWLISQGNFEWRGFQELSMVNLRGFICHEPSSFISHQTIVVLKKTFIDIGGFNVKFKVAADTAQIIKLFYIDSPLFSNLIPVQVERPNFAARNHRRGRLEVAIISVSHLQGGARKNAILNICKNESIRFLHKFAKLFIRKKWFSFKPGRLK